MKFLKLILTSCFLLTCLISEAHVRKVVIMNRVIVTQAGYNNEIGEGADRIPEGGIVCVIDQEQGVELTGTSDEAQIVSYEIWDSPSNCVGVYYDEISFVKKVVKTTSTCKIRINTDQVCYEGILNK